MSFPVTLSDLSWRERCDLRLAVWRWGGGFLASVFPYFLFSIGARMPDTRVVQNRTGHFTGVHGSLLVKHCNGLSFRLGFHEIAGWERKLIWKPWMSCVVSMQEVKQ